MWLLLPGLATQRPDSLGAAVRKVVRVSTPRVVLEHVNVIDGTGTAPTPDRNITIDAGRITAISAGADVPQADGTTILDLSGYSVMPGIVGMHNHLIHLRCGHGTSLRGSPISWGGGHRGSSSPAVMGRHPIPFFKKARLSMSS